MLQSFSDEYGGDEGEYVDPDKETIVAVLGKKYGEVDQYSEGEQKVFQAYHKRFQLLCTPHGPKSHFGREPPPLSH